MAATGEILMAAVRSLARWRWTTPSPPARRLLTQRITQLGPEKMDEVCRALIALIYLCCGGIEIELPLV